MKLFSLANVLKTYGSGEATVHALNGLNLEIDEDTFLSITGRSGSGKSTLMKTLAGLVRPDQGTVHFRGTELSALSWKDLLQYRRRNIGIISQSYSLLDDDTSFDNISLPLRLRHEDRKDIQRKTMEITEMLGISDKNSELVRNLSGGQRQRVAIARALITQPAVILADEPTGALDRECERIIMEILRSIHMMGTAIILITHDMEIAQVCHQHIVIDDGRVVSS